MAQKVRVFKLASDFGLDNDAMVAKIQEFGYTVRNYMSAIDQEQAQQIRRLLQREREENTVEEQIRPTVVRRRTKTGAPVKPTRIRPPKEELGEREAAVESKPTGKPKAASPAPVKEEVVAEKPQVIPEPRKRRVVAPKEIEIKEAPQSKRKRKKVEPVVDLAESQVPEVSGVKQVPETPKVDAHVRPSRVVTSAKVDISGDEEKTDEPLVTIDEFESAPVGHSVREVSSEPGHVSKSETVAAREQVDYEDMTKAAFSMADGQEDTEAPSLRPASQAPIIRRRVQVAPDNGKPGKKGAAPRRRQVESRDIAPPRRAQAKVPGPAAGPGRKRRMVPGKKGKKTEITTPKASKRIIKIEGQVTLQELAKRMSVKSTELLMKLMALGMSGININSTLDVDTSKIVAEEFGYEVEDVAVAEDDLLMQTRAEDTEEEKANRITRAPIVTMMGHVDHGKTSLLDYIRKANVVDGEAGGITQHIGAYRVKTSIGEIAFIDTPGHAAFTAMRARGADVTDIVVLVCAADDGVMPQTIEAIDHARAGDCPIIVAINKCDVPAADPERARRMLMEHNLLPEELGGDTIIVEVSAKTGQGVEQLLEMISLQSEMMELSANPKRAGAGVVLEAYLDRGRGPVANILVQEGTLKAGDIIVAGSAFGKIRAMTDERGRKVSEAGPATPVEVLGLSTVPSAGDTFDAVSDMKTAEKVGSSRDEKHRASIAPSARPSLEALYQQMQSGEQAELKVVIKSDVQGTMEALRESLTKLTGDKVKVSVVSASVGGITESDVLLASTAGAIIIGFNVRPAGKARRLAEEQGVEIKIYSIIYEIIDAVKAAMLGLLAPTTEEEVIGMAEVRDIFSIPRIGTIAGSYVTDGRVVRNGFARLIRDSVQIWEGKVSSLRRFKDDAKEVASGFECGIGLQGYNDIKVGDVIEFYLEKEVEATLS